MSRSAQETSEGAFSAAGRPGMNGIKTANEEVSSSLFGQIMWTYFYDRCQDCPQENWWTTITGTLEREERAYFLERAQPITEPPAPAAEIDLQRGDRVRITDGPFESHEGTVAEIIEGRRLVKVMIIIFNRPTPVDLDYWQLERV